jgi:hypothetical protein
VPPPEVVEGGHFLPQGVGTGSHPFTIFFFNFYKKKMIFKFYLFTFLIDLYFFVMDTCRFSIKYDVTN